jgi:HAD superfamily hydrolase (TIGR01509 family)
MMSIKSLIFDFDGVILDTETPEFQLWQEIYRQYGHQFPDWEWAKIVGSHGLSTFDPAGHLAGLTGNLVDAAELRNRHQVACDARTLAQPVLPGVKKLLQRARAAGLKLGIASSSPHDWVDGHLARLGLLDQFHKILCAEDVEPGRTKPNPDLYLKALNELEVSAPQAIVFEDSLNGVKAARAAGIFVVAVPNPATSVLGVDGANLTLPSLEEFNLADYLGES